MSETKLIYKEHNMPRLDGTGPEGKGEMTGRGLGECNRNSTQVSVGKNSDTEVQRYYGRGRSMNNNQMRGRGMGPCGLGMRNGLGRRKINGMGRGMGQGLGRGAVETVEGGRGLGLGRGRGLSAGAGRKMGRGRGWN